MCTEVHHEDDEPIVCVVLRSDTATHPNYDYIRGEMLPWMLRNLSGRWIVEAVTSTMFVAPCWGGFMHDPVWTSTVNLRPLSEMRFYFERSTDAARWRMFYEFGWKGLRRMRRLSERRELGNSAEFN